MFRRTPLRTPFQKPLQTPLRKHILAAASDVRRTGVRHTHWGAPRTKVIRKDPRTALRTLLRTSPNKETNAKDICGGWRICRARRNP